ncbi:hypothetical protein K491DRAFT_648907 [Lophiostoma macrostomum CBS 122681]|uniref:Large ribosomal subunit protein mL49 n=1 Tax=Lophiostoma macrostomum CBS 122681 TaxID=1314788 RepID=A0A6A6TPZ5_9PLEO|nr:hypothetical protein K491DRAFT_648907 [Lophiostoma macrostomum CBS 122681]
MPRIQSLMPVLRPLGAPRASIYRPLARFSTATRLRVEQHTTATSTTSTPSEVQATLSPGQKPSTPEEASRAADLAAAEAATDADNPNPPSEKPILPSKRSKSTQSVSAPEATSDKSPKPKKARWSEERKAAHAAKRAAKSAAKAAQEPAFPQKGKGKKLVQPSLSLAAPRYTISRSETKNLPIYTDYKRGGNLHTTTIRKITGDISALRDELRVYLNKGDGDVRVNNLTQQVVVKGHHKLEISKFLQDRGF